MKNKRTFVGLLVILALLCLGIGYAAISRTLYIEGGVATGETTDLYDNFIVYFSKVEVNTDSAKGATVTANLDPAAKSTAATFSIQNMSKVGSKVVLTYTVNNDSEDLYANGPKISFGGQQISANQKVSVGEVSGADPYFTITVTPNLANGQAAPKSTHTITIVVEMTNSPLKKWNGEFAFYFVYDACDLAYSG